jgi:hypothetical protein
LGSRGVKESIETVPAGFALLYPPYYWVARPRRSVALRGPTWIATSARMREEGIGTRPCRGLGCPQYSFFFPQEWGIKGG